MLHEPGEIIHDFTKPRAHGAHRAQLGELPVGGCGVADASKAFEVGGEPGGSLGDGLARSQFREAGGQRRRLRRAGAENLELGPQAQEILLGPVEGIQESEAKAFKASSAKLGGLQEVVATRRGYCSHITPCLR